VACIFVVYDVTNASSFTKAKWFLNEVKEKVYKNVIICLLGNKIDLCQKDIKPRQISQKKVQKSIVDFQDNMKIYCMEISAFDYVRVKEIFEEIIEEFYDENKEKRKDPIVSQQLKELKK